MVKEEKEREGGGKGEGAGSATWLCSKSSRIILHVNLIIIIQMSQYTGSGFR